MLSKLLCSSANAPRMLPKPLAQLRDDFKADNADTRDGGLLRDDYEKRISEAKGRLLRNPSDPECILLLAEAYGVFDPEDKRCLEQCEELLRAGPGTLDLQRHGDFWHLYGRSLFLADRADESLLAFLKAKAHYKEKGTKRLRKQTNTGLLRVYAALGKSKLAAERLEVALTLCDDLDEIILLYAHAKHALEHTGCDRDAEVLDDIWYVALDERPQLRTKYERFDSMVTSIVNQRQGTEKDGKTIRSAEFGKRFRRACRETCQDPTLHTLVFIAMGVLVWCLSLLMVVRRSAP